jgi:hypothetical protein
MYLLTTRLISCRSLSVISVFLGFNIWPITLQQQQMQVPNVRHAFQHHVWLQCVSAGLFACSTQYRPAPPKQQLRIDMAGSAMRAWYMDSWS